MARFTLVSGGSEVAARGGERLRGWRLLARVRGCMSVAEHLTREVRPRVSGSTVERRLRCRWMASFVGVLASVSAKLRVESGSPAVKAVVVCRLQFPRWLPRGSQQQMVVLWSAGSWWRV